MGKFKRAMYSVAAIVSAFILVFAVGCNCGKDPEENPGDTVTKTLQSIELDTSEATTVFFIGDAFSSEGLKINVTYLTSENKTETETITPSSSLVTVDSGRYNNKAVGTYPITVIVLYNGDVLSKTYDVEMFLPHDDGISLTLKDGAVDTYTLTAENPTADISGVLNFIEVRKPDRYGNVDMTSAPLASSSYTVEVYSGNKASKLENDKLTAVGSGIYQVWVTLNEPVDGDFYPSDWVFVYVNDVLTGLEFNASGSTTTQMMGKDTISSTWTFTVSFISGATKTLTKDDVNISGLDTETATDGAQATVKYTNNGVTKETTVNYVIEKLVGDYEYKVVYYISESEEIANQYDFITEWDGRTGLSSDLVLSNGITNFRNNDPKTTADGVIEYEYCGEIKSDKNVNINIKNAVEGSVNITVYVSHATAGAARTAQLYRGITKVAEVTVGAVGEPKPAYLYTLNVVDGNAGNYRVTTDGTTMRFYAVEISYTAHYE